MAKIVGWGVLDGDGGTIEAWWLRESVAVRLCTRRVERRWMVG
jgi:hypothetical protein